MIVLVFAFSVDGLAKSLPGRIGQCVLTCPTTACYNGIQDCPKEKRVRIGGMIRYFGDGFQKSKKLDSRRFWRIPVMDGEFVCEDWFGTITGVAGGNLLICGTNGASALRAAEAAVKAMRTVRDIALPFPGGIVRSGSKVGSRYPKLKASTNDAYCPTLRSQTQTELPKDCHAVYEIVVDGLSADVVKSAMKSGLQAAAAMLNIVHHRRKLWRKTRQAPLLPAGTAVNRLSESARGFGWPIHENVNLQFRFLRLFREDAIFSTRLAH